MITRNLRLGLEYTGKKAARLRPATIRRKQEKGRANPSRVFYDKGMLVNGLKIVPLVNGFRVMFKSYTYPESNETMDTVARKLHEGTDYMVARPFFGITSSQFRTLTGIGILGRALKVAADARIRRVKAVSKGKVKGTVSLAPIGDNVKLRDNDRN